MLSDLFKRCSVHPHIKNSNLDKDDLGNYRPICHLSFLSKLAERVVRLRPIEYLSTNVERVKRMKVFNDSAEREIAVIKKYNQSLTMDEEQKQFLLCFVQATASSSRVRLKLNK